MIEQKLLFLGLLKESPKHGYEIKKRIKDILSIFAGVEIKSIYYPLKKLQQEGYLSRRSTKSGRRPTRFVYTLTAKGEAAFEDLLYKSLLEFKRPLFSLDLSLYFLPYMQPATGLRRLRARIQLLHKLIAGLSAFIGVQKEKNISAYLLLILEHNLFMLQAEERFLKQLTETL